MSESKAKVKMIFCHLKSKQIKFFLLDVVHKSLLNHIFNGT